MVAYSFGWVKFDISHIFAAYPTRIQVDSDQNNDPSSIWKPCGFSLADKGLSQGPGQ